MTVTCDVVLPEEECLTVNEVNVSHATLRAAAPYIGKHCEGVNNEFMLCRYEEQDPRACLELGMEVTECTIELFQKIKSTCADEFNQYVKCIDKSSGDFDFVPCRKTQEVFDYCMKYKLEMDRPDFGYFCRARIHESPEKPPEKCPPPVFPNPSPALPADADKKRARFTSRFYWMSE